MSKMNLSKIYNKDGQTVIINIEQIVSIDKDGDVSVIWFTNSMTVTCKGTPEEVLANIKRGLI